MIIRLHEQNHKERVQNHKKKAKQLGNHPIFGYILPTGYGDSGRKFLSPAYIPHLS